MEHGHALCNQAVGIELRVQLRAAWWPWSFDELDDSLTGVAAAPKCDPDNGGLNLPAGFCALVVADASGRRDISSSRRNGDLYVALRATAARRDRRLA